MVGNQTKRKTTLNAKPVWVGLVTPPYKNLLAIDKIIIVMPNVVRLRYYTTHESLSGQYTAYIF